MTDESKKALVQSIKAAMTAICDCIETVSCTAQPKEENVVYVIAKNHIYEHRMET